MELVQTQRPAPDIGADEATASSKRPSASRPSSPVASFAPPKAAKAAKTVVIRINQLPDEPTSSPRKTRLASSRKKRDTDLVLPNAAMVNTQIPKKTVADKSRTPVTMASASNTEPEANAPIKVDIVLFEEPAQQDVAPVLPVTAGPEIETKAAPPSAEEHSQADPALPAPMIVLHLCKRNKTAAALWVAAACLLAVALGIATAALIAPPESSLANLPPAKIHEPKPVQPPVVEPPALDTNPGRTIIIPAATGSEKKKKPAAAAVGDAEYGLKAAPDGTPSPAPKVEPAAQPKNDAGFGTTIAFTANLEQAREQAFLSKKLVFLMTFSGSFEDGRFTCSNTEALRTGALASEEVGKYLSENVVAACQQIGTSRVSNGQNQAGNVACYFCLPDGCVLHAIAGPADAEEFLREARWVAETRKLAIKDAKDNRNKYKDFFRKAHQEQITHEERAALDQAKGWGVVGNRQEMYLNLIAQNRQLHVHQVMASNPLAKVEQIHKYVFERILGEKAAPLPVPETGK